MARLRPWYGESRSETRRTALSLSVLEPESAEDMAALLALYSAGEDASRPGVAESMPAALRVVADDLKTFYLEAAAAQPGQQMPGSVEFNRWLYHDTKRGSIFDDLRDRLAPETPEGQRPPGIVPNMYAQRPE